MSRRPQPRRLRRPVRRRLVAGLFVLGVGASIAPAATTGAERGDRSVVDAAAQGRGRGGRSERGDRIRLGGRFTVAENEVVGGDVVVIAGRANIRGEVRGDVVVVMGRLTLGPESRIGGEATVVGGRLERAPGARIARGLNEVVLTLPEFDFQLAPYPFRPWRAWARVPGFIWSLLRLALLGLVVCVALALAPGPVTRVGRRAGANVWLAGLMGLVVQVFFLPIMVLTVLVLTISIIGIPLLLLVPPLLVAAALATVVGFAAVAQQTGRWVEVRLGASGTGVYRAALLGLVTIASLVIAGRMLGVVGGIFGLVAWVLLASGLVVEYAAWTVGIGALVLQALSPREAPAAPPPQPPAPETAPPSLPPALPPAPAPEGSSMGPPPGGGAGGVEPPPIPTS